MRGIANGWLGGILLASACQVAPSPAPWSAPQGAEGSVALASGATVRWSLHHDRNALRDSRLVGDSLVAIAQAGTLLRFDAETLELTAERCEPVRCLGDGPDDELLAGLSGGRVVQVEPRTLACREVARVAGELAFVGRDRRGLVAVTVVLEPREVAQEGYTLLWEMPAFTVHDLASGRTVSFRPELEHPTETASAWLLDSRHRLWLGFDLGEWGGHWVCVDLERLEVRDGKCSGLYGFLEGPRGRVLAFGGVSHLGMKSAFVAPMTSNGMNPALFEYDDQPEPLDEDAKPASRPSTPVHPIAQVIEDPEQNGYLVLSLWELWRADLDFRHWTKLADLKVRTVGGRPDAMGSYPGVCAVHQRSGQPLELLATTRCDGIWRMRGTQSCSTRPDQLPLTRIDSVLACAHGTVLVGDYPTTAWLRTGNTWANVLPRLAQRDNERRILVDREGALVVAEIGWSTHNFYVTRGGERTRFWSSEGARLSRACLTPDDTWWRVNGDEPPFTLLRVQDDTWGDVGTTDVDLHEARPVNRDGPPWWLQGRPNPYIDGERARLARLAPDGLGAWEVTALSDAAGRPLEVRDALALDAHTLLLATPDGVMRLARATSAIAPATEPMPQGSVRALCHDRAGRLWIAGDDRVWVRDGAKLHDLGPVQPLGFRVQSMISDPEAPTGVVMVLQGGLAAWVSFEL